MIVTVWRNHEETENFDNRFLNMKQPFSVVQPFTFRFPFESNQYTTKWYQKMANIYGLKVLAQIPFQGQSITKKSISNRGVGITPAHILSLSPSKCVKDEIMNFFIQW